MTNNDDHTSRKKTALQMVYFCDQVARAIEDMNSRVALNLMEIYDVIRERATNDFTEADYQDWEKLTDNLGSKVAKNLIGLIQHSCCPVDAILMLAATFVKHRSEKLASQQNVIVPEAPPTLH